MDIGNLEKRTYKNYKEMCKVLGEPIKTGEAKKNQIKKWGASFKYRKDGNQFIVTEINSKNNKLANNSKSKTEKEVTPSEIKLELRDIIERSPNEIKMYYNMHGKLNAQMKRKLNTYLEERMDYTESNNIYTIKEIYERPLPRNIAKMRSGLYQYIVPLILQGIILSKEDKVALTVHKIARNIEMINKNYDIIDYHRKVFTEFDEKSLADYFNRIDSSIKYYIMNAIELMEKAHIIDYQYVNYIQLKKTTVNLSEDKDKVVEEQEQVNRKATDEEVNMKYLIEKEAMEMAGIDPLKDGIKACYYGEKAKLYYSSYNAILEKYNNKDSKYLIERFYKAYELFSPDKEYCEECLKYFNTENMIENFNNHFIKTIMNNAAKRSKKDEIKYNGKYMEDYSSLVNFTIPQDEKSILGDQTIREAIYDEQKRYIPVKTLKTYSKNEKLSF